MVTDDGDGTLSAAVTYDPADKTITNTYEVKPVSVDPPVQKVIKNNSDLYNKGDFTFKIANTSAPEGVTAPMPTKTTITNVAANEFPGKTGWYEFGVITFTEPGEYVYTVTESGSVANVTNDPKVAQSFTFNVIDDGSGKLKIDPETDDACWTFTNVYEEPKDEPSIKVAKSVTSSAKNGKYYQAGETVKYKIVVTNNGDVDLTDVAVTDELTGDEWTIDSLAVGASETFTASHKVSSDDVSAGSVENYASAAGHDPDGNEVTDDDTVTVTAGKITKSYVPPHRVSRTGDTLPIALLLILAAGAAVIVVFAARRNSLSKRTNVENVNEDYSRNSDRYRRR